MIIFAQNFLKRNSFAHSNVTDLHFLELHNSIKNTLWKPRQSVVVDLPGQAKIKQQCETMYCTHSQRLEWYATSERTVHYTCTYKTQGRGSEHAGHQL